MREELDGFERQASKEVIRSLCQPKDLTKPITVGRIELPPLVDLERYEAIMIQGDRGSGKSAWGEKLLETFWEHGRISISLTEAPFSYESMFTAIPRDGEDPHPVLFIIPEGTRLIFPDRLDIITRTENESIESILRTAKNEERMVVFCHSLWPIEREREAYLRLAKWIREMCLVQRKIKNDLVVLVREIEMQGYSRIKSDRSTKELKSALIDLVRLARSSYRMTVIADLQLAGDLDRALRGQLDKWIAKSQDPDDLPESLKWIGREIERRRSALRGMSFRDRLAPSLPYLYPQEGYYVLRRHKRFLKIELPLPRHRHKTEREDIEDYGIFVKGTGYRPLGNPDLEAFRRKWMGTEARKTSIGTKRRIARDARALLNKGQSYNQIAKAGGFNTKTIWNWIREYD